MHRRAIGGGRLRPLGAMTTALVLESLLLEAAAALDGSGSRRCACSRAQRRRTSTTWIRHFDPSATSICW